MPQSLGLLNPATDWNSFMHLRAWFKCCLRWGSKSFQLNALWRRKLQWHHFH